jgi:TatD DNase family protein
MRVDAHAHVDRYTDRLVDALGQIEENRILTLSVSMDVESYERAREIAQTSRYVIPTFGIHPWEARRYCDRLDEIESYLRMTPIVGEAGLDFHWVEDKNAYPCQVAVFEHQCKWARVLSKPMNLHTKGAEREVLEAIVRFNIVNPIIHWYSGPGDLIDSYLSAGSYFTIGVEVLHSLRIQEIARAIPAHRILLETDNPGGYEWLKKETGMPVILVEVLKATARLKGVDEADFERQLEQNWHDFKKEVKGGLGPEDPG